MSIKKINKRIDTHLKVILIFLFLSSLLANAQEYPFEKIGLEQGLPTSRVNDFIEDSRGFFWIATDGAGLVRYDGYEFVAFSDDSEPASLLVNSMVEDADGNLWLSLETGIARFDGISFSYYFVPDGADRIVKVITDDNLIYALSKSGNIYTLEKGRLEISFKPKMRVKDAALVNDSIYVASDEGLYVLHHHDTKLRKIDTIQYTSLSKANSGVIASYSGAVVTISALGRVNLETNENLEQVFCRDEQCLGLAGTGKIWLKQGSELSTINETNGLEQLSYKGGYIDRSGVFWLYSDKGLTKLESTALEFYGAKNGFDEAVLSCYIDAKGHLFTGTSKGLHTIKANQVKHNELETNYNFGPTLAIAEYNGEKWLGTEKGLVRYDGETFKLFNNSQLQGDFVFSLLDTETELWVSAGTGIYKFKDGVLTNESRKNNLPFAPAYSISKGKDGSIWFATYAQGLIRYYNREWSVLQEYDGVKLDTVRFNTFTALAADDFWVGSLTDGLYHFKQGKKQHITYKELEFAEIRSLTPSVNNKVWAGTNKGILEISQQKGVYNIDKIATQGESIPNAIFSNGSFLLVGTSKGLQKLKLKDESNTQAEPKLALTGVRLSFSEENTLDEYANSNSPFNAIPLNIELPHDLNFLSFNMAGLTGLESSSLIYRYRLKGQTDDWTLAGSRREAVFSNIKPGTYQFEAQVARKSEGWSPHSISYSFKILRPYWKTWWFIFSLSFIVVGLSFLFVRDRISKLNQRLKLENALLEMERKALRLQMNPHFIFNALDSISSFIFKNDPQQAVKYLNNFAKLMRLTLESSMEHLHPVETEVSILKNYLELEKLRFQGKFEFFFEVDDEIDFDVGIPPMLIQPHVENAILHGLKPKKEDGELHIRFNLEEEILVCEVEDNGIGRKESKALPKRKDHRSMATQINKDRLRLLKLSMSNEVEIEIIDKEMDGKSLGTKVIIRLPAESI